MKRLFIVIGMKNDEFRAGLKDIEKGLNKFKGVADMALGAGMGMAAGLGASLKTYADLGSEVYDMSKRTGLGAAAISQLKYAADQSGTSIGGLEKAIKQMQKVLSGELNVGADVTDQMNLLNLEMDKIAESEVGDKIAEIHRKMAQVNPTAKNAANKLADYNAQIEKIRKDVQTSSKISAIKEQMAALQAASKNIPTALEQLNLKISDLENLSPEDQFNKIMESLASIEDPALKSGAALAIFGKSGTDLLPMLDGGVEGMKALKEEATKAGVVFTDEGAAKADKFGDSLHTLQVAFTGIAIAVATHLVPALQPFIDKLVVIIENLSSWISKNPELIQGIMGLSVILIGAGGLYYSIKEIVNVMKSMAVAMTMLQALSGPKGWLTLAASLAIIGGATWGINELLKTPAVPGLASGGIVTSPTMAMVGESGPEAIVPLSQLGQSIEIRIPVILDGEKIAEVVDSRLYGRMNGVKGYV